MILSSKGKVDDKMKKLISFVLAAILCGCMLVATPITVSYAEDSNSDSNASSESGEINNEQPVHPLPSADAQLPKGEMG